MNDTNDLGSKIQAARKRKGLTQKQLAESLELATGTIQQYELGKRKPKISQLRKIAKALNVSTSDLIEEEREDTTAHDYQAACDLLEEVGFTVEPPDDNDTTRILDSEENEVGYMNIYDLIRLCQKLDERGEAVKLSFIKEVLNERFDILPKKK